MASGWLKKLLLDGKSFNVKADSFPEQTPRITTEAIRHSGGNSFKVVLQHGNVESVTVLCTASEFEILMAIAKKQNINMSYTEQDGSVYVATGCITLDNRSTEENACDVTLMSNTGDFKLFGA